MITVHYEPEHLFNAMNATNRCLAIVLKNRIKALHELTKQGVTEYLLTFENVENHKTNSYEGKTSEHYFSFLNYDSKFHHIFGYIAVAHKVQQR